MEEHRRIVKHIITNFTSSTSTEHMTHDDLECVHIALFGVPPPWGFAVSGDVADALAVDFLSSTPSASDMFTALDRSGRGYITAHDLMAAVNEYNSAEDDRRVGRIELSLINEMFEFADTNSVGQITQKQFRRATTTTTTRHSQVG